MDISAKLQIEPGQTVAGPAVAAAVVVTRKATA
jgi:hypothetical protein